MKRKFKIALSILLTIALLALIVLFFKNDTIALLSPKGTIALKQFDLLVTSTWIMLIVVIPVFILTWIIAWKYRASNQKAKYNPNWDNSVLLEWIWWGIPFIIIIVLSVITWKSCIELDPFKPLVSDKKPIKIQVVALQWKWLFIYPEQNVATLNYVQFPEKTPINFEITSDAPMNSFWIPRLGGQIYAMPGMASKLHLIADEVGSYPGSSANLSGRGFSGMKFIAKSCSEDDFNRWVASAKKSGNFLSFKEYEKLVEPSENSPQISYELEDTGLFEQIIKKYTQPVGSN